MFLLGLSAGYLFGGVASARRPDGRWLAAFVLAAGVSVLPVTAWHGGVCDILADSGMGERWAALSAALILFLLPCALLGAISPFAVHLVASEVSTVGLSAGALYALSTVGSFLGTLLTSFYFVLWLNVSLRTRST